MGLTFHDLRHDVPNWSLDDLLAFKQSCKDELHKRADHKGKKTLLKDTKKSAGKL